MGWVPYDEYDEFPRAGVRARRWQRFERDLRAWLDTPEGRFAAWSAAAGGAQAADEHLRVVGREAGRAGGGE
jgi:hypothetical protein